MSRRRNFTASWFLYDRYSLTPERREMARMTILATVLLWVAVILYSNEATNENDPHPSIYPVKVPSRPYGIKYDDGRSRAHIFLMEVFLDVASEESRQAFSTYLSLVRAPSTGIQLVFYQFPLPYHRAAIYGSQVRL